MTIDRWITDAAVTTPEKCAIEFCGETLSYRAMAEAVDQAATDLQERGVGHGDRVAWYGLNHPKVFILLFACARIGAIFVPLNWRLAPEEINQIVADCEPAAIFCDQEFQKQAQSLPVAQPNGNTETVARTSDPLLIVYTSGSTGRPKGVVLAQDAVIANAEMSVQAHGLTPEDTVLNVLPTFHVGGLNILPTPTFSVGGTVLLHASFDPRAMIADLQRVHAAIVVPTVLNAVLETPEWATADLSHLRCLSIGSTDVPIEMIRRVHDRGVPMLQIYGATETAPFAIYQTYQDAMTTEGSLGKKGMCDIRLMQPHGDTAPIGEPGEIWVRGPNTLSEYWRDPAQTGEAVEDGWFKTGDVATCDENGQFYFTGRIKHIIISGGENIYPVEIERALSKHPQIAELSVVGIPDPKWGETPVVVAVKSGDVGQADVLAALDGVLARYKHPKSVVFVDKLPRNSMGKIQTDLVKKLAT
jgi:fatty-acyl-CoA synthase